MPCTQSRKQCHSLREKKKSEQDITKRLLTFLTFWKRLNEWKAVLHHLRGDKICIVALSTLQKTSKWKWIVYETGIQNSAHVFVSKFRMPWYHSTAPKQLVAEHVETDTGRGSLECVLLQLVNTYLFILEDYTLINLLIQMNKQYIAPLVKLTPAT